MAQQTIFLGTNANDGTGESLRGGGSMINSNFTELYALLSNTINAGAVEYAAATSHARVQLAIDAAVLQGKNRVYVPQQYLPYDASLVTFNNSVQMVREGGNAATWDVLAYGATPNTWPTEPTVDDSAAIQAAINTGHDVDFVGQFLKAANLTQSTDRQVLHSSTGIAHIMKAANGPIITSTGSTVIFANVNFRGELAAPVLTGDNVVFSGNNCSMLNCGSRWAFGRAVKATGGHFQILGTCDIYQSYDPGGTGYDIEIGVSGTATLYHKLSGIYSSQGSGTNAGGILFIDCGSQVVEGGQFGKLTIQSGTSPAGVNGGIYMGNRILGTTTIGISGANFSGNQFGAIAVTINAGVSGVSIDSSNSFQVGATLVNNGSDNNALIRSVGAAGYIELKYGEDTSVAIVKVDPATGQITFPDDLIIPNNTAGYVMLQTNGTAGGRLTMTSADRVQLESFVANQDILYQLAAGTSGAHRFFTNGGTEVAKFDHTTTAGQTRFMVYDVDNGTLERVTVGAADSGGVGFKVLRIPN